MSHVMMAGGAVPSDQMRGDLDLGRMERVLRRQLFFVCLVLLAAVDGAHGQMGRQNTWSARTSAGRTFIGTWTAAAGSATGTAAGTWTLVDAQGKTLASGVWTAAKSPAGWTGSWRAANSASKAEYSGTWSAGVDLKADAPVADLFAKAVQAVVGGTWRAGRQSGQWSIRGAQ
jgi:hypothetical protein